VRDKNRANGISVGVRTKHDMSGWLRRRYLFDRVSTENCGDKTQGGGEEGTHRV